MGYRLVQVGGRTIVRDVPRGMWVFGSAFIASGLATLSVPVLFPEWSRFVLWEKAAMLVIGLAHLAGGCCVVWSHTATETIFDHESGIGTQRVRRPFQTPASLAHFEVGEVRTVEIRESTDDEGGPMFQLRLRLRNGRAIAVQGQAAHVRERAAARATALRQALSLPDDASTVMTDPFTPLPPQSPPTTPHSARSPQ